MHYFLSPLGDNVGVSFEKKQCFVQKAEKIVFLADLGRLFIQ